MRTLPKLNETAQILYLFAFLMGAEDPWFRQLGSSAMVMTAVQWARYIEYQRHLQDCPACAARAQLRSFIAERT